MKRNSIQLIVHTVPSVIICIGFIAYNIYTGNMIGVYIMAGLMAFLILSGYILYKANKK